MKPVLYQWQRGCQPGKKCQNQNLQAQLKLLALYIDKLNALWKSCQINIKLNDGETLCKRQDRTVINVKIGGGSVMLRICFCNQMYLGIAENTYNIGNKEVFL